MLRKKIKRLTILINRDVPKRNKKSAPWTTLILTAVTAELAGYKLSVIMVTITAPYP